MSAQEPNASAIPTIASLVTSRDTPMATTTMIAMRAPFIARPVTMDKTAFFCRVTAL